MGGWARENDLSECDADHATGPALGTPRGVLVNKRAPLCLSDRGAYAVCCGKSGAVWVVSEGNTGVLVQGVHAAGLRYVTTHQAGKGSLILASGDVLIGGATISMEELARADALAMLDKGELALNRWNADDKRRFKEWFGTDSEEARQEMLKRIRSMRERIKNAPFEQENGDAYAYVYPWGKAVHLEEKFWVAPRTGPNSRAGTIIHESSHFWGSGSTSDHVYGRDAARQLAKDNPEQALGNADNNEYFFEDQP